MILKDLNVCPICNEKPHNYSFDEISHYHSFIEDIEEPYEIS